jgi:ribosomal protein S21
MPTIDVSKCNGLDSALRRLKRLADRLAIPKEAKKNEFHMKGSAARRAQKQAAIKRQGKLKSKLMATMLSSKRRMQSRRRIKPILDDNDA